MNVYRINLTSPDTDHDRLQNAEEDYGWTVKRDINGDGDTNDNIYYGGVLYYKETLLPYGEGGEIRSLWTDNDTDSDGLNDREEKQHHTHPQVSDTDHDLLSDWDELKTYGTDPLKSDTDLDGLSDWEELNTYGTDPLKSDPDGDGLLDGEEVQTYQTDPWNPDTDGDGMTDLYEVRCGVDVGGWQDPLIPNNKYAILICWHTGYFWDGNIVTTYEMLKGYGYTDENIIVLYVEEHPSVHPEYVDYKLTPDNLTQAFNIINQRSTENDFIFIYATDHGNHNSEYTHSFFTYDTDQGTVYEWDDQFAQLVNSIQHYARMLIALQFCYSGGFIDDLSGNNRIIVTSAPYCLGSYGGTFMSVFSGYFIRSLSGYYNADTDSNGYTSIGEAWNYAFTYDAEDYIMYDDNGNPLDEADIRDVPHHGPEPYYQDNKYYWDVVYENRYGVALSGHIDGPGYHGSLDDPYNTWGEGNVGRHTYL